MSSAANGPRQEGVDKVSGRARYSTDVRLPGQVYARVLRSALPHARIRRLDTSRAERLPGVHALLSHQNAPALRWYDPSARAEEGTSPSDGTSWLFDRMLRFVGDEIVAVAADSEEVAEDALRLVDVEYERLPARCDAAAAADWTRTQQRGEVAVAEKSAHVVLERRYTTPAAVHHPLEPHACVASWENGTLTLYESTQGVNAVRDGVAQTLELPPERVRVICEHMGGGFGSKQLAWKHSVIAALLARRCGRPVQLVLDRESQALAAGFRQPTEQYLRLGARGDGSLVFIDARLRVIRGAYEVGGEASMVAGLYQTLYRCDHVRIREEHVRLNTGPAVAFRAPGFVEAAFALESAMDELAHLLELDPVELRLRNLPREDQRKGKPYTAPDALRRCCEQVTRAFGWSDWRRPPAAGSRRRGIGFAAHNWLGGSGYPPAQARVQRERGDPEGARVVIGSQDIGTGTRTVLAQIAAAELGLPVARVTVSLGDTACGLAGPVSHGSATLASLGPAVRDAAARARVDPNGTGYGERAPNPKDLAVQTCGAQCAEVEVDVATGELTVLRIAAAHDCGRVIHAGMVAAQVMGGIVQGLGYACSEGRVLDARLGVVLNPNLEEYLVPTAADIPQIVNAVESMPDTAANALGAKGIGEPPIVPTAPAIANAVFDATGIRVRDLPLLRARLLR